MERGLYAAASGMIAQQNMQDSLAQNIANASTVGYKQDNTTFRALQGIKLQRLEQGQGRGAQIGELGMGTAADKTYTDWQGGAIAQTNQPLDASLENPQQFFAVSTPSGERYTRAGNFQVDAAGNLLSGAGQPVVSTTGQPLNTGGRADVTLDANGNLRSQGRNIGQLKIVQIAPAALRKDGNSLFAAIAPNAVQPVAQPSVRPGTLEQSNVNIVRSLVQMINVTRGYDMAQRAITTQDDLLKQAQSDLGQTIVLTKRLDRILSKTEAQVVEAVHVPTRLAGTIYTGFATQNHGAVTATPEVTAAAKVADPAVS